VASSPDPRISRALLAAWVVAAFAISATSDLRVLGVAAAAAALAFRRGIARTTRRVLRTVVPVTAAFSIASWAWLRLVAAHAPATGPFLALGLRTSVIAFITFAVLERVDLFRALAPWPTLTRLLVVTLAQIHALRLLATESLLGLRSRMPRKPGTVDVVRGAGGLSGALFTLSARNARDISDAMRSRGF
jgi:cobalt/nickel transport system permease protein